MVSVPGHLNIIYGCFLTIFQVKVIQGHEIKRVKVGTQCRDISASMHVLDQLFVKNAINSFVTLLKHQNRAKIKHEKIIKKIPKGREKWLF